MIPFLREGSMLPRVLAVIDLGSNTCRVTVFRIDDDGPFEPVADSRLPLKLLRRLAGERESEAEARADLLAALKDFKVVADGAGAEQTVALATYAIRSYPRADNLIRQIEREFGMKVHLLDGEQEAELGFLGAAYGLDVEDGILIDLGGGSAEIGVFRQRSLARSWSLPLGALLLSDTFLKADPPSKRQIANLLDHVETSLEDAGISPLSAGERLIATGGSVRNLAKLDQAQRRYPIPQLHGYALTRRRLRGLSRELSGLKRDQVSAIPGINPDRKDSIVAASLVLNAVARRLKAKDILISGQGLREALRPVDPAGPVAAGAGRAEAGDRGSGPTFLDMG